MNMVDRIQYLRKTKGLSQEEFTDKVGMCHSIGHLDDTYFY